MENRFGVIALVGVGLALAIGGLVVGLMPLHAGVACGSGFVGSDAAASLDLQGTFSGMSALGSDHAEACEAARSTWRVVATLLLVVGAFVALTGLATTARRAPQPGA